jgi:hypothetical protein
MHNVSRCKVMAMSVKLPVSDLVFQILGNDSRMVGVADEWDSCQTYPSDTMSG